MPCLWGAHNGSQILVPVLIVPPSWVVGGQATQPPNSVVTPFQALLDTGATNTAISAKVANTVGLKPMGKIQVQGVSGQQSHNYYTFHVGFMVGQPQAASGAQTIQSRVDIFQHLIQGAELALGGGGFDVLLGMDILGKGSLAVEGNGTFSFSF